MTVIDHRDSRAFQRCTHAPGALPPVVVTQHGEHADARTKRGEGARHRVDVARRVNDVIAREQNQIRFRCVHLRHNCGDVFGRQPRAMMHVGYLRHTQSIQ